MNENTNAVKDISPDAVKNAVGGMSFEEKMLTYALMQVALAFEAAKNVGKATAEENKARA